ncbi:MAG: hypothetical protein J6X20_05535 [Bacteroidales bacterium]|nr:hypothetical protein [Bacteroidales bacterium]
MKVFKLSGIIFLLLAALVTILVAFHRTAQPKHVAQTQMSQVEMMAIDEIIDIINIIYNQWMGKSCYVPQYDNSYPYANSCAFLTASGTLGGVPVDYADDYYDNPLCYYRIQAQQNNQQFDKWQCTSMWNPDFVGWWGPATWEFQSASLVQTGNATQDVLAIAAIMSNNQGFILTEWDMDSNEGGHIWALSRIMLHQRGSGQNVTYTVDYEIINAGSCNNDIVKNTWSVSCEDFMDLFTDVQNYYVY